MRARFVAPWQALPRSPRKGISSPSGIAPTGPETGYGYIQAGERIAKSQNAFRIKRFVEKPSAAKARGFLARGGYLWNSGMFAFGARRYLEELARFRSAILAAARKALEGAPRDLDFLRLEEKAFAACPATRWTTR